MSVSLRWSLDPAPSHIREIAKDLAQARGVAGMHELAERVARREDPLSAVYQAQWIHGDVPFFDRESLRTHSKELIDEAQRPLLRVNGDSGFGLSYTTRFFDFLSQEKGDTLHIAVAPPEVRGGSVVLSRRTRSRLVSYMGNAKVPARATSSYPAALRRFVLGEAAARTGRWIFLLEGFNQEDLQPEVKELIQLLARSVCDGDHRKRMRLVLIDCPADLPSVLPADILEDNLKAPSEIGTARGCALPICARRTAQELGRTPLNTNELERWPRGSSMPDRGGQSTAAARLRHVGEDSRRGWT